MANKITSLVMPKWGLSMNEGTLAGWRVQEGQVILPGQEVLDVETEKIANTLEAVEGGLLRRKIGQVGRTYPVKALLGVLAPPEVSDAEIDAYVQSVTDCFEHSEEPETTPAYRFSETAYGRLRYVERPGTGCPIIFVHGFGGDLDGWLFNIDSVTGSGPVYAVDLPGHGGSVKAVPKPGLDALVESLEQFMASLRLANAHLVGHSMGGAVAANLAVRGRGLVSRLTLISPAGLGEEINADYITGFIEAKSRKDLKLVLQKLFASPDLVSRTMLDNILKFKRVDGVCDSLRQLATTLIKDGRQRVIVAESLAQVSIPVQVIWGARDEIIPVKHATALPNANVEILENAGHMSQMEAANRVNELIRQFGEDVGKGRDVCDVSDVLERAPN